MLHIIIIMRGLAMGKLKVTGEEVFLVLLEIDNVMIDALKRSHLAHQNSTGRIWRQRRICPGLAVGQEMPRRLGNLMWVRVHGS